MPIWPRDSAIAAYAIPRRISSAATRPSERLQGYALQGWFAPNITNDARRGLGSWSVDEIVAYLQTGHNQTSVANGLMAETINLSTSHMSDADLKAIAVYLKDQPGQQGRARRQLPDQTVMKAGAQIYADECSGCHTADGKGDCRAVPVIQWHAVVQQTDPTSLLHVVLRGALSVGTDKAPTAPAMPAFGWVLDRRSGRRRCDLYPQCLGQCRAAGRRRRSPQAAAKLLNETTAN